MVIDVLPNTFLTNITSDFIKLRTGVINIMKVWRVIGAGRKSGSLPLNDFGLDCFLRDMLATVEM